MISTKDLSGLPNAERLKKFCKGLAALDIIMLEEEWNFIRHYAYNPVWRKGKEAFFATDGSDQSMIVLFAPEGCVINGVDSELYDWEEKLPHIEDLIAGMPPALQKLMTSREVKKMKSTFCVWTEDGTTWHCNPMDGEDASKDLLPTIDGNPQTYVEYGKWFYPADLPLEAVRQLADGVPVTKELVAALNPKRNEWEEIKAGLDKIGYSRDARRVYYLNREIKGADRDSFAVCTPLDAPPLADHLARDKDHFYQNDEIMEETQWLEQLRKMTQEP